MNTIENKPSYTLEHLYQKVSMVLSDNFSLFQGLTICDVSVDKKLTPHYQWQFSYYTGTTKKDKNNFSVSLKIPNHIIIDYHKKNGTDMPHNASYDIVIENLTVSSFGVIQITARAINETGVSDRELLRRRLEKFCKERGYLEREKKALPRIVTSILAITSKYSEIQDDVLSNTNIASDKITVMNCDSSEAMSHAIREADSLKYNLVVLYRGGREDEAMNMFSEESIIESIAESKIPVCVALGHDMDTPFIYIVADQTYSTPSAFGKAISIHNNMVVQDLSDTISNIKNTLANTTERFHALNIRYRVSIEALSIRLYEKAVFKTDKIFVDSLSHILTTVRRMENIVGLSSSRIESLINGIHLAKIEFVNSSATAMKHHTQILYKAKDTELNNFATSVRSHCEQIIIQSKHNEIIKQERKDKHKLYIASGIVIAVLIVVILSLIL